MKIKNLEEFHHLIYSPWCTLSLLVITSILFLIIRNIVKSKDAQMAMIFVILITGSIVLITSTFIFICNLINSII